MLQQYTLIYLCPPEGLQELNLDLKKSFSALRGLLRTQNFFAKLFGKRKRTQNFFAKLFGKRNAVAWLTPHTAVFVKMGEGCPLGGSLISRAASVLKSTVMHLFMLCLARSSIYYKCAMLLFDCW
jgi:hypothetical protein